MSHRYPVIPLNGPSGLGGNQFEAEVKKHHGENPHFQYKDKNGAPIGPFAMISYTPELFGPMMAHGDAILNQSGVSLRSRELAILAVVAVYEIPFVRYAHTAIALKAGLSETQIALAVKGEMPDGLIESERVTYAAALELAKGRGPLDEEVWKLAEAGLGKEGIARVAQVVGLYLYVGTFMRLGDVPAPTEDS
ncbi:MAG: hypothetical protein Q9195_005794 [Heterodermia aff. obscurata]